MIIELQEQKDGLTEIAINTREGHTTEEFINIVKFIPNIAKVFREEVLSKSVWWAEQGKKDPDIGKRIEKYLSGEKKHISIYPWLDIGPGSQLIFTAEGKLMAEFARKVIPLIASHAQNNGYQAYVRLLRKSFDLRKYSPAKIADLLGDYLAGKLTREQFKQIVEELKREEEEERKRKENERLEKLRELAKTLYEKGFNVIPVDIAKGPVSYLKNLSSLVGKFSWSAEKRLESDDFFKALQAKDVEGIAIVAGPANPFSLIILDVDDPKVQIDVSKTVSWKSGIRCPKCGTKHFERPTPNRYKCMHCEELFDLGPETPRGYGAIFRTSKEVIEWLKGSKREKGIEFLVNNYQVIPPSKHLSGVIYEWIKPFDFSLPDFGIAEITKEEIEKILSTVRGEKKKAVKATRVGEAKTASDINAPEELVETLLKVYKEGHRQMIWLYLSGWGAKARVNPVSLAQVLKTVYEKAKDDDSLKMRASALVYSYKKAGIDLEPFRQELEALFGFPISGLEKEIQEENVKGVSGLLEIFKNVLEDEERALDAIRVIEEKFGKASPYRDAVFKRISHKGPTWYVADLAKGEIYKMKKEKRIRVEYNGKEKIVSEEVVMQKHDIIVAASPIHVEVLHSPFGGTTKYKTVWYAPALKRTIQIMGRTEEITARLKREGLILNSRLASDAVNAVILGFIEKGRAEDRTELGAPGVYLVDGKLETNTKVGEVKKEELNEALEILDELATKWFGKVTPKFAEVVKWGILSPFFFALKQRGVWIPWLFLYGPSQVGKTTIGEVVLYIWGLPVDVKSIDIRGATADMPLQFEIGGASIDTIPKFGERISKTTFPTLVNEVVMLFNKEDMIDTLKNSIDKQLARSKIKEGSYEDYPALSPMIFTSNKYIPRDDALIYRFRILIFTPSEAPSPAEKDEFNTKVKHRLKKLSALGDFVMNYVIQHGLPKDLTQNNWREFAENLLIEAYMYAGRTIPSWIAQRVEEEVSFKNDLRELVKEFLNKRIDEAYFRSVGKVTIDMGVGVDNIRSYQAEPDKRVEIVVKQRLIPWLFFKNGQIYLTSGFAEEMAKEGMEVGGGLKAIAEHLGWEYKDYTYREDGKVRHRTVIAIPWETFLEFLIGELREEPTPSFEEPAPTSIEF
jgi:polyhydroxyalkanoate synthesis regulator phasin/ribosomal protein L37AE/L43A